MSDRAIDLQEHTERAITSGAQNDEDVIAYVKSFMGDFYDMDEKFIKNLIREYFGDYILKNRGKFFEWLNTCPTHKFEVVYDDYDGVYVNFDVYPYTSPNENGEDYGDGEDG